ncbi:phosphatidylserine decarboxylase proenzyme [Striga asiatica]|uniref:Phosphatidylserine decarboxylase proenzyme n=1 Tax=Striga asiatica TaxID=4170 RepID=A0A5A7Q6R8_STRAF|nr:phosphatidylserine decarboxylase proenzyme [Striga asiatica]
MKYCLKIKYTRSMNSVTGSKRKTLKSDIVGKKKTSQICQLEEGESGLAPRSTVGGATMNGFLEKGREKNGSEISNESSDGSSGWPNTGNNGRASSSVDRISSNVGRKIRARVSTDLQMKFFGDQRGVDFVDCGVWALKFFSDGDYRNFVTKFQGCLFENVYGLKPTEENKSYNKDFLGWVKPEDSDDSMWEDGDVGEWRSPDKARSMEFSDRENQDLLTRSFHLSTYFR